MHSFIIRLALLGVLLLSAAQAMAQAPGSGPWSFRIEGGFAVQSDADLKDEAGAFSVDRTFVGAAVDYTWDYRNAIGVSVGGGESDYDFEDFAGFTEIGPWGEIEDTRASISGRFGFGEKGIGFLIPTIRFNGEKGADSGDSSTWGLFAGAAWIIDKDLTIGPGFGVFSRLEDSTRFFPILIVDWNISERWNLSTGRGLAASQGPGLTLTFQASKAFSLGLAGRYEENQFRLDDEGEAPGGVGRDKSLPLVLTAAWEPNRTVRVALLAGLEFAGKLKLEDESGQTITEHKYDPAPVYGATFEFRFGN